MYSKDELLNRISEVVDVSGLSREAFARRIGTSGATMFHWLRRRNESSVYLIANICDEFDVSADWLIFGRGSYDKKN